MVLLLSAETALPDEISFDAFIQSEESSVPLSLKAAVQKIKDLKTRINRNKSAYEDEDVFLERIAKSKKILNQFLSQTFILVCTPSKVDFLRDKKILQISYVFPLAVGKEKDSTYVIKFPVSERSGRLYVSRDQMLNTFIHFRFIDEQTIQIYSTEVFFYEEIVFSN